MPVLLSIPAADRRALQGSKLTLSLVHLEVIEEASMVGWFLRWPFAQFDEFFHLRVLCNSIWSIDDRVGCAGSIRDFPLTRRRPLKLRIMTHYITIFMHCRTLNVFSDGVARAFGVCSVAFGVSCKFFNVDL